MHESNFGFHFGRLGRSDRLGRLVAGTVLVGFLLAGVLPGLPPAEAAPVRYVIGTGGAEGSEGREGENSVVFVSEAPMESFEGRTTRVAGTIVLDPAALGDSLEARLEVDLASLDTGIALRNQHMRENHLETERFPQAVFTGATLVGFPASLTPGIPAAGKVVGTFDLHGVARRLEAAAELTLGPDGALAVHATFEVHLADHGISRPKFLVLKLDERQRLTVDLVARPVAEGVER